MAIKWLSDLVDNPMPKTPMIISGGVLPESGSMLIYGEPGVGKSMLTMHIARCLATGIQFFRWNTKQSIVILKQVELPESLFKDRVEEYEIGAGGRYYSGFPMIAEDSEPFKADTSYGLAHVISQVEWVRERYPDMPVTLIFDPLYKVASGHLSDQYDATKLVDNLDVLRHKHKVTIIVLHHNHKTRRTSDGEVINEGQDAVSGSGFLQAWPDTIMRMWRTNVKGSSDWVNTLVWEKYRFAKYKPKNIQIRWDVEAVQPTIYTGPEFTTDQLSVHLEDDETEFDEFDMLHSMGGSWDGTDFG